MSCSKVADKHFLSGENALDDIRDTKLTGLKIGVFQYQFPFQVYTRDLLLGLADAGCEVYFFVDAGSFDSNFVAKESLNHSNITIKDLLSYNKDIKISVPEKMFNFFRKVFLGKKNLVQRSTINHTRRNIRKSFPSANELENFSLFIGIEKQGLLWAGMFSEHFHVPYCYYSLELLLSDYEFYSDYEWMREYEIHYHQKSSLTIIQDEFRADVLLKANNIPKDSCSVFCFPVCSRGAANSVKSSYFHNKFSIPLNKKIILYFGLFARERECNAIANLAAEFSDAVVVFHGYGIFGSTEFYDANKDKRNVYFSLDLVDEEDIDGLISSADIGIALYNGACENDKLTAFSSMKISLFMKNRVPIIAYDNESYRKLFSVFKCGKSIDDLSEFVSVVNKMISSDLGVYQLGCEKAFNEFYSFDKQFTGLLESLYAVAKMKRNG